MSSITVCPMRSFATCNRRLNPFFPFPLRSVALVCSATLVRAMAPASSVAALESWNGVTTCVSAPFLPLPQLRCMAQEHTFQESIGRILGGDTQIADANAKPSVTKFGPAREKT
ncbi:hypothetical protein GOP47_0024486 [Adiantum capillus-veneris]|uniref:Uncharacterized protein n=1 Tax=Adiantum capillus-veneris TaxID=13818 RepID=A0A9D4U1U3_ADICA|nr:hypothetical protein GOP47_0024486 [Adiantum capillus-veneris]